MKKGSAGLLRGKYFLRICIKRNEKNGYTYTTGGFGIISDWPLSSSVYLDSALTWEAKYRRHGAKWEPTFTLENKQQI